MTLADLHKEIALGEDSTRQFKADLRNGESLAAEMVAFANAEGGMLLVGVADDGSVPGLSQADVHRINQLITNVSSQQVRSPLTVHTQNLSVQPDRLVIVLKVPKGIDKPYFDNLAYSFGNARFEGGNG
ncbi:MAG: ATP-binding protein [Candidatus Sericytochromatia bacterium]|nr:ATP-binding protein [Candidatus Sericytochromatia bacterium]